MKTKKFGWFSNVEVILAVCGNINASSKIFSIFDGSIYDFQSDLVKDFNYITA